jgi:peroxin-12
VVCWRCGWEAIEGDDEDADVEEKEKEAEGGDGDQVRMVSRRKGRCPITGVEVLPGQLRRVLV